MGVTRTGIGFDAHRLVPGRRLVLGGVDLDYAMGLAGHSDADVLCHAVTDALLGAVADGDIGRHFPDTDDRWRDACSVELLRVTRERLAARGVRVISTDSTIIAEEPKLSPHVDRMREALAAALGVEIGAVSVKATTVETMGALGRKEGIAAFSVVNVVEEGRAA